ncbi:GNAT family N-acetyltransferase [Bacillus songklensis]|uniref:GNAT family N-acetyltransferase n=1 Tax=Bacillus songklensis TaxID=1069116 RepID=A0ABV8B7L7_9BACI
MNMPSVSLVPHQLKYGEYLFQLSADSQVYENLSFRNENEKQVAEFIESITQAEVNGTDVSRVILNEEHVPIGVTTLMGIDPQEKSASLGSWLGVDYWRKGYNEAAKREILRIAFLELGLEKVFIGTRKGNIRSQKAQKKLPYITLHVETQYPSVHQAVEEKEKQPCILNVVYIEDFLDYLTKDGFDPSIPF